MRVCLCVCVCVRGFATVGSENEKPVIGWRKKREREVMTGVTRKNMTRGMRRRCEKKGWKRRQKSTCRNWRQKRCKRERERQRERQRERESEHGRTLLLLLLFVVVVVAVVVGKRRESGAVLQFFVSLLGCFVWFQLDDEQRVS